MKFSKVGHPFYQSLMLWISLSMFVLSGCSSDDDSGTGYVKFYNASPNAPGIFLTVDENLDDDDDDEIEVTYSSVDYTEVSGNNALDTDTYFIELAWQDEESSDRSDLEIIYEDSVKIKSDTISFIALTGDVREPEVLRFDIDVVDDDDDDDDDLFNIRLLNIHSDIQNVDLYVSKDNETFNEAEFLATANYQSLSDNIKLEQDQYIFYITLPGSTDVIYTSVDQSYSVVSQYIIVLRDNTGVGSSDFTIDSIGINGITELQDVDSEAEFSFYNAISSNDYLPDYQGNIDIDVRIGGVTKVTIDGLTKGEFSVSTNTSNGDYAFDVLNSDTDELYIKDALLSLKENADNTIFLYGRKDAIDEDEDGDIDENSDGIVDDYEIVIKSLTLTKSSSSSIYSHGVKVVNLANSEDFSRVTFYFVLNDEIISTADNLLSVLQENSGSLTLLNNTYDIYAVATIDGTDIVLDSMQMVLSEISQEQYLIFEQDENASSGYQMLLVNQKSVD
ncbi:DUF4397 domain-containing protein [uncultured Paraglaciecola sp.]|uniref:DUF4397 domain-containing protein n=1 Tax=uncultured Paraglaciecola sp. TaxID=1765024 RepID=UPI0030DDC522